MFSWATDRIESGVQFVTGNEEYEFGDATQGAVRTVTGSEDYDLGDFTSAAVDAVGDVAAAGLSAADDLTIKAVELIGMESPLPFHDKVTSTKYEQALYANKCAREAKEHAEHGDMVSVHLSIVQRPNESILTTC